MRKPAFVMALVFAFAQFANAALIDNGTYLTDTASGLDWLKLTETTDRSYADISSQFGVGGEFAGWQYATGDQFESLLFGQGIASDAGCAAGINFCGGVTAANMPLINSLINSIGDTFEKVYGAVPGTLTSEAYATVGILGDAGADPTTHYVALLVGSYLNDPYARTHYGDAFRDKIHEGHIGSYLVRLTEVPVPAAGYLFMTGLLGLFGRQRLRNARNSGK
jgi:hypothetical protein